MQIQPALVVAMLWLAFVGLHVALTTGRIRPALVARLGERGFVLVFSAVASVSFACAIRYYARHRFDGVPGLALGDLPVVREILIAAIVVGIVLMAAGSITYPGSPYDLFARRVRAPRGIERVTRHPFFAGVALLAVAHALLATRLVGTVTFASLAVLAIAGAVHQDRKLLMRLGRPYADYLAATSAVPFTAIVAGRQRLSLGELPTAAIAVGVIVAATLRAVHAALFAHDGLWVIVAVVGAAAVFGSQSGRRAKRAGALPEPVPARP